MATSPEQKNTSSLWREFALFACVAAFGAYSAAVLVKPHSPLPPIEAKATFSRAPASSANAVTAPEKSTRIVSMGCLGDGTSLVRTEAGLARIMADECRPARSVEARNETTGESLMIFQRSKKISTHYFPLKQGENKIVIEWLSPKGVRSAETLVVDRIPN